MGIITSILIKYGQTLGALEMAAMLRYLEKTSLIQKYKRDINQFMEESKKSIEEANNSKTPE